MHFKASVCTYDPAGKTYSLDNGVPVSKKLATELTDPAKLQADSRVTGHSRNAPKPGNWLRRPVSVRSGWPCIRYAKDHNWLSH
jgi:hypothetical protein